MSTLAPIMPSSLPTLPSLSLATILQTLISQNHVSLQTVQKVYSELSVVNKKEEEEKGDEPVKKKMKVEGKKKKEKRVFTLDDKRQRHISLSLSYDGSTYGGFSENVGEAYDNSVEKHLFEALIKTRLVVDRKSSGYGRCGRTDKGVSANGQVVHLNLRSAFPAGSEYDSLIPSRSESVTLKVKNDKGVEVDKVFKEMDYVKILNGVLPPDLRIISSSPVTPEFSSRFSCTARTYRYFFIRRSLNISKMIEGCSKIVGEHDFRNIAKMDTEHVSNFRRRVYEARVVGGEGGGREVCYFEIRGQAFLWHMVRNIVQLMFFIGKGLEEPSIIDTLFDITSTPRKPNYKMAADYPLVLHKCDFNDLRLRSGAANLWEVQMNLEGRWERLAIRAEHLKNQIESLGEENEVEVEDLERFKIEALSKVRRSPVDADANSSMDFETSIKSILWKDALKHLHQKDRISISGTKEPPHIKLHDRKVGLSYEEKVDTMKGKKLERYQEAQKKGKPREEDKEFYRLKQSQGSSA